MKKITLALSIFIFSALTCRAQERKFELGINLFPNYSIGIISNDGTTPSNVESGFQEIETWKPSISTSIFVEYQINEKSFLGLGMGYQNNGERTKKLDLIFGVDPTTGSPITDPSLPTQARFVYNHHNIEVPIYYRHMLGSKFFILVGTSGIFNISNTTTSVQYFANDSANRNTEKDNSTEFRGFNISGNFGFGLDYLTNEKFSFFVLPFAQYGFLGISKTASLNRNFLSLGISTGIRL